jgi:hypothetical protein
MNSVNMELLNDWGFVHWTKFYQLHKLYSIEIRDDYEWCTEKDIEVSSHSLFSDVITAYACYLLANTHMLFVWSNLLLIC